MAEAVEYDINNIKIFFEKNIISSFVNKTINDWNKYNDFNLTKTEKKLINLIILFKGCGENCHHSFIDKLDSLTLDITFFENYIYNPVIHPTGRPSTASSVSSNRPSTASSRRKGGNKMRVIKVLRKY